MPVTRGVAIRRGGKTKVVKMTPKEIAEISAQLAQAQIAMMAALKYREPRVVLQAALIVVARAKEIITEKGHIITGSLRRSINAQVQVNGDVVTAQVGSFMEYAEFVEDLPDGGYLFEASEQTFDEVSEYLFDNGLVPLTDSWAEVFS